jgi:uncharacterized PurR-regulated membrane protein YhhQ (DUF165 family)
MNFEFDYTEKRVILSVFFCVAFIIANLTTVKIMEIPYVHMEAPAGVLIYPLVYVLTNVIAEVYGEKSHWQRNNSLQGQPIPRVDCRKAA